MLDPAADPRIDVHEIGFGVLQYPDCPHRGSYGALGILKYAEPNLVYVNARVGGWVEHLYADYVGKRVQQGEPLLALYSPDLVSALAHVVRIQVRSEEHTSELQSRPHLVCRLLLEKKKHKGAAEAVPHPTAPALLKLKPAYGADIAMRVWIQLIDSSELRLRAARVDCNVDYTVVNA